MIDENENSVEPKDNIIFKFFDKIDKCFSEPVVKSSYSDDEKMHDERTESGFLFSTPSNLGIKIQMILFLLVVALVIITL